MWSAGYFFFLLLSYFMLRPVREALGTRELDKLVWLMTGTMVAMVLVNPLFAWLVSRMPRRRFIPLVNRFFMLNLLLFAGLVAWVDAKWVAYSFYIWLSVYNLFVVSVFWAFMADAHGTDRSRRVFGLVGVGGTAGAIAGAWITQQLVTGFSLGSFKVALDPAWMLVAAMAPLELAVQCMRRVSARAHQEKPGDDRRRRARAGHPRGAHPDREEPVSRRQSASTCSSSPSPPPSSTSSRRA